MDDILAIFGILFGIVALETLMLVFIIWKTPAMKFLSASMTKSPLMYIIGKDRMGYFKTFKSANGAAKLGKDGLYHLTENSHTLEAGSKTPIYFAFRDLAATLLPEYPAIVQELREKGIVINNVEDINKYIKQIKAGIHEDLPVTVQPYKTYKFHDLENMFPNNLDPTFLDATVQSEVSRNLKMMKNGPMMMGGLVILIFVGALAIFIINRSFKGCIDPNECQAMVSAAKCSFDAGIQAVTQTNIV